MYMFCICICVCMYICVRVYVCMCVGAIVRMGDYVGVYVGMRVYALTCRYVNGIVFVRLDL